MRGHDSRQPILFSYVSLEARIPKQRPLRVIRSTVDRVLETLSGDFERLYARVGRPSVPPEQLLRALLVHFSKNRDRLLKGDVGRAFFRGVVEDGSVPVRDERGGELGAEMPLQRAE